MNQGMKTSKAGLDFIAKWEGTILTPYMDVASLWTIGVGHLIKPTDSFSTISNEKVKELLATKDKDHPHAKISIPRDEALLILAKDVAIAEHALIQAINVPLSQNQFDALISFGFNCGTGVFRTSGVCKAILANNFHEVPDKLLEWSKVRINGQLKTNKGLFARRTAEGQLFSSTPTTTLISWTPELLIDIQTRLKKLGFYRGKVDGITGPMTKNAMEQFSIAKGIKAPTSGVSSQWVSELTKASS